MSFAIIIEMHIALFTFDCLFYFHKMCCTQMPLWLAYFFPGVLQLKKENGDLSATPPRKGMIVVDDEPEKEPQPKCCT